MLYKSHVPLVMSLDASDQRSWSSDVAMPVVRLSKSSMPGPNPAHRVSTVKPAHKDQVRGQNIILMGGYPYGQRHARTSGNPIPTYNPELWVK